MVPGAPVATSGILFAVPAFREWLRLSVRTTYHSPIPLSICGAPCRPALCPSRPPTFPPSDSPALRLSRPPTLLSSAYCALRPSRSALCLRLRLRLSARTPFAKLLAVLPSAHRVLQPSRSAHCLPPRPRLSARTPFARLLAVPPSVRSALCPFRPLSVPPSARPVLCQLCPPVFFLPGPPLSLPDSVINLDGHFRGGLPSRTAICIFPSAGFQHTLIYLIYIRSECRFRTPPGTVLFCRSDAAASLPVCLSACLLVRRTFHLNFFRLLHLSSYLPPDLFAPCRILRPSFFAGRPSLIPAFRPSRHSPIRFFLRLPRPFSRLFPGNLPPRSEK